MNRILEKDYVENLLQGLANLDYLDYNSIDYVSNRIVVKLIGMIKSGSFSRFGEVLEYNINTSLIKESFKEKMLSNINSLRLNLMVVKSRDKILIVEAEVTNDFFGYINVRDTLAYIKDNFVWFKYYRGDEYSDIIENEISSLGLIFVNSLNKEIKRELNNFVSKNFPLLVLNNSFKKKLEEDKKRILDNSLAGYTLLKHLDSDIDRLSDKKEILPEQRFENIVKSKISSSKERIILSVVNESLNTKELLYGNDINHNLYINDNERFWSIIESNIEDVMLKKASLSYAKIQTLESNFEAAKSLIYDYNLVKEYNTKISDITKEINNILENKEKTITIEYGEHSIKTKSKANCIEKLYRDNQHCIDSLTLNRLCFSIYGGVITILDHAHITKFNIKIKKTVIYEFKEDNVREIVELVEKIKNSKVSELFDIYNK